MQTCTVHRSALQSMMGLLSIAGLVSVAAVTASTVVAGGSIAHVASAGAALGPRELGLIVNERDPLSVAIGDYYRARRGIPESNVIRVSIDPARTTLGAKEFATLKAGIDGQTPDRVQAYALTWVRPYRVECMSITTAIAMGFDDAYCGEGCSASRLSSYFNSDSHAPFADLGMRPAMNIAALDFARARELIDRGMASDGKAPRGTAYLVETPDVARNVRARLYGDARMLAGNAIRIESLADTGMRSRTDVMFYFTGDCGSGGTSVRTGFYPAPWAIT